MLAGGLTTPIPGPSDHTKDELKALQSFTETKSTSLPRLIAWKTTTQPDSGPLPGGYMAYIVMTLMPGQHLMDLKFWSQPDEEKEAIRKAFIPVLKYVVQFLHVLPEIGLSRLIGDHAGTFGALGSSPMIQLCEIFFGRQKQRRCQ